MWLAFSFQIPKIRIYQISKMRVNVYIVHNIDGLVKDFSNSSALAMELLQYGTKPSIYMIRFKFSWVLFTIENTS